MYSKSKIGLFSEDAKVNIKNRLLLKKFIEEILRMEKKEIEFVNFIFCSDKTLLKINRQYLKHDYYTDILTFDLSEKANLILSDIYISIDRVKENSKKLKLPFTVEFCRVVFHGILHLCGYSDKKIKQKERLKEQLIAGYKASAKSKKLAQEDKIWEEAIADGLDNE